MFQEITDILHQETVLFKALVDIEREKRNYILSAHGPRVRELTSRTEIMLGELEKLEKARRETWEKLVNETPDLSGEELTLDSILELSRIKNDPGTADLEKKAQDYRSTAEALKKESGENSQLLQTTGKSLTGMLEELKELAASGGEKIYAPENKGRDKKSRAVLLNANA